MNNIGGRAVVTAFENFKIPFAGIFLWKIVAHLEISEETRKYDREKESKVISATIRMV